MTIREMAKAKQFEIIGKLKRDWYAEEDYDPRMDRMVAKMIPVWHDEAGNEYWKETRNGKEALCIVTYDGRII